MADFNFGKIGALIEATKASNANIDFGPPSANLNGFFGQDVLSYVTNSDLTFSILGNSRDFIWGGTWGNTLERVGK